MHPFISSTQSTRTSLVINGRDLGNTITSVHILEVAVQFLGTSQSNPVGSTDFGDFYTH